jgi:uncharacterized protein (TIGR03435 family)
VGVLAMSACVATAQGPMPAFDVASVKPAVGDPRVPTNTFVAGGRYVASYATLRSIIALAYQPLFGRQITGGPAWIDSEMFEIQGKAEGNPPVEMLRLMLRALLADRFKLRAHTEQRDTSVYALVVARADRRPGPQLKPGSIDCSARRDDAPPPDEMPRPASPECGFFMRVTNYVGVGLQFVESAKGITMQQLASQLTGANAVGRVVVDRTGLTGSYDVDLTFAGTPSAALNAPSVFAAVEEQLGLKLESTTATVDFVVIDDVQHPTPD